MDLVPYIIGIHQIYLHHNLLPTRELEHFSYKTSYFVKRIGWSSMRKRHSIKTVLDFAVWLNIDGYVRAKGRLAEYNELLHATKFKSLLWKWQVEELGIGEIEFLKVTDCL